MTLDQVVAVLTPFALAMRVQIDEPTFRAYHALLRDVPVSLVRGGLDLLAQAGVHFFPTAMEIRVAAEKARRAVLALNRWRPCDACAPLHGWREVTDDTGVTRVERCSCRAGHQQHLAKMGLATTVTMLPGEAEHENEQVYPTVDQLPLALQKALKQIAAGKVMP